MMLEVTRNPPIDIEGFLQWDPWIGNVIEKRLCQSKQNWPFPKKSTRVWLLTDDEVITPEAITAPKISSGLPSQNHSPDFSR